MRDRLHDRFPDVVWALGWQTLGRHCYYLSLIVMISGVFRTLQRDTAALQLGDLGDRSPPSKSMGGADDVL